MGPGLSDDAPLHLGTHRLTLLALNAPAPTKEAADVNEGAAGAVEQAVNRAGEARRVG